LIFVKPKPKTKKKWNKKSLQLSAENSPSSRDTTRGKSESREKRNTKAEVGAKQRELGCQGRKGRSDGEENGGRDRREREREREKKRTNYSRQKGPPFSGPIIGCHFL
jgi:hypothetical protein